MHHATVLESLRDPLDVLDRLVETRSIPRLQATRCHEAYRRACGVPCGTCKPSDHCSGCPNAAVALALASQATAAVAGAFERRRNVPVTLEPRVRKELAGLEAMLRRAHFVA